MDAPVVVRRFRLPLLVVLLAATAVLSVSGCLAAGLGMVALYHKVQVASIRVQNNTDSPIYVHFGAENGGGHVPPHATRRIKGIWAYRFGFHPEFVAIAVGDDMPPTGPFYECLWDDAKSVEPLVVSDGGVTCTDLPADFWFPPRTSGSP